MKSVYDIGGMPGWIEQQLHNSDRRVKLVTPSGKLEAIFDSFAKEIESKFLLP